MAAIGEGDFLHYKDMEKVLKNFLLWNPRSDFEIISQEYSLGDPFKKLFTKFWSVHKHGSGEWGHMKKFLKMFKKSSSLKPMVKFWNNFTGILFWWPFSKTVCDSLIRK